MTRHSMIEEKIKYIKLKNTSFPFKIDDGSRWKDRYELRSYNFIYCCEHQTEIRSEQSHMLGLKCFQALLIFKALRKIKKFKNKLNAPA